MIILNCTGASLLSQGSYMEGSGPIYLSELLCTGTEASLLECDRRRNRPTGLQTCDHSQDVFIQCTGSSL